MTATGHRDMDARPFQQNALRLCELVSTFRMNISKVDIADTENIHEKWNERQPVSNMVRKGTQSSESSQRNGIAIADIHSIWPEFPHDSCFTRLNFLVRLFHR
jgi:hypothetical protein